MDLSKNLPIAGAKKGITHNVFYLRETLNRRARSLTYLRPIFELEANKGRQADLLLGKYDLFRLTSTILDVIITEMGGFQQGAAYEQILEGMVQQIKAIDPSIDRVVVDKITSFILDCLTNEKARDSFRMEYQHEAENGQIVWRPLIFKLVELRDIEGTTEERYVAKPEAINIYLNSLSVDLEGQQAADEAALTHFIKHGKFEEAELSARTASMRTTEYADRIKMALQLVERGVSDLDWVADIIPRINAARDHIEERLRAENFLVSEAERKIEEADTDGRLRLVSIIDLIRNTSRQHEALLNIVLRANSQFLAEHANRKFRPAGNLVWPQPQSDVLRPLLRLSLGAFDAWIDKFWFQLHPPRAKALADFSTMTRVLLSPKREYVVGGKESDVPEFEEAKENEPPFSTYAHESFERVMDQMPETFHLSEFIRRIGPEDIEACHLSIIKIGDWYEGHDDQAAVSATGESFINGGIYGDDLVVVKPK